MLPEKPCGVMACDAKTDQVPTADEMGVEFISRDDLPDTIPMMSKPVDGWAVYSGAEGESPTFEGFFVDEAAAEAAVEECDDEGEKMLFDAFVFEAILIPEGLITCNDYTLDSHDALRERIGEWMQKGGPE